MAEKSDSQRSIINSEAPSQAGSLKNLDPTCAESTNSLDNRIAPEAPENTSPKTKPRASPEDDILIVDWDGPDDPENPKK